MTQTIPCPFAGGTARPDDDHPDRAVLRAVGPLVRVEAPAGGPVWIVTDAALAREVLADPRIVKDTALAPAHWDPRAAGLEQTAAEQLSLTTQEGAAHTRLRKAHAPLLGAARMRARAGECRDHARTLLTDLAAGGGSVDLTTDFTTRYPLTVICALLGVPADRVDDAVAACRRMHGGPAEFGAAMGQFAALAASALAPGRRGLAAELRDRVPAGTTDEDLAYLIFTLIFAGQLTSDAVLGFVVARALTAPAGDPAALVDDVLRVHPPAPFTLWRFTAEEVDLAGHTLPPRSPVLVDIAGIDTRPDRAPGDPVLTFGAGPHYCVGAQLARVELTAVVEVLATDFPDARLAVPVDDLRRLDPGNIEGSRLAALPVDLGARALVPALAPAPSSLPAPRRARSA